MNADEEVLARAAACVGLCETEQIDLIRALADALERRRGDALDAARYRWLRLGNMGAARVIEDVGESLLAGDDLDAAVDAAMREQPK